VDQRRASEWRQGNQVFKFTRDGKLLTLGEPFDQPTSIAIAANDVFVSEGHSPTTALTDR
jgi:hypothetical protein